MIKVKVTLTKVKTPELTYLADKDTKLGTVVTVPFRNSEVLGVVTGYDKAKNTEFKLKEISRAHDFELSENFIRFIDYFCNYFMIDKSSAFKMSIPVQLKDFEKYKSNEYPENINLPILNDEQQNCLNEISSSSKVSLLYGVTGSGKTEVYFHLIAEEIKKNKQVLLMLPEIGLANQIISRFKKTFGFDPVIWHSDISPAKKRNGFFDLLSGKAKVTIGTRSSMFLPFKNLGLTIIDEEHDPSYKQEEQALYNARDSSVLRSSIENNKVVLVSATPSVESVNNVNLGKYDISNLTKRYADASMPEINIVDMKKEEKGNWISKPLSNAIQDAINNNLQSILYINRRGYSPLVLCRKCSFRFACKYCSSWLVYHKFKNKLICHHCGYFENMPSECSECGSESLVSSGPGVERIVEEAKLIFPEAKICSISKDTFDSNDKMSEVIEKIENAEYDIIIGTQIITKGYHFPKVSVVGIIDADIGSSQIDLKANERCFQVINQVSGRAGREKNLGRVFVQTFYPDNILFTKIKNFDLEGFYKLELEARQQSHLPPFARAVSILITGGKEIETSEFAKFVKSKLNETDRMNILGPAPASMSKIKGNFRYRILILADKKLDIQNYLKAKLSTLYNNKFNIRVEIDPNSFY